MLIPGIVLASLKDACAADRRFQMDGKEIPYAELASAIERVPGVVAHGLCLEPPTAVMVASSALQPQLLRHGV